MSKRYEISAEESVEAWRLSEIGLTPESSTTGMGHRAVFMAHHAPYFLSIAHYTGDDFLRDIARSAVVGRYRNFPGYHINTDRTTAYEKVDFPFRKHEEISVNSFHYNHPFPHISILIDYLVTDAFDKSGERIAFPSRHIEGYGYLQNRFYGMEAGRFYSEKNVWLWLPSGLVEIDDVELNYLSGRSENSLCLAFMNQSDKEVESDFVIDTDLVPDLKGHSVTAQVWSKDRKEGKMVIKDVTVNPMRISHDAKEPVAYRIGYGNKKVGICTDLGIYNDYTVECLKGMDALLIEANHDVNMLQVGTYPYYLKQRILGERGHLSNENSGRLLSRILHDKLQTIILGHLSKENNLPELAYEAVRMEITMGDNPYNAGDFKIQVANRSEVSPVAYV